MPNRMGESFKGRDSGGGSTRESEGSSGSAHQAEMKARINDGSKSSVKHTSGTSLGDFLRKRQRSGSVKQDESR